MKRLLILVLFQLSLMAMEEPPKSKGIINKAKALFSRQITPIEATNKLRAILGNEKLEDRQKGNILFSKVKPLIEAGADKEVVVNNSTILEAAVRNGKIELVDFLLKNGANPNHGTPLVYAAFNNDTLLLKRLLEAGANVQQKDKNGLSSLYHALFFANVEMVRLLIAAGADLNEKTPSGLPLLHLALGGVDNSFKTEEALFLIVKLFKDNGADLWLTDSDGLSAMQKAQRSTNQKIRELFVQRKQKLR